MTFSFFVPCLVACRILASDQGSNLVSSESAQVLTTGLPGNSQMILAGKLMYPRCLLFCKNYVQDRVYLPPGHRASNRRSCALISGHISPGSFSLAQMSSIPPFGSGDEFIGWQALLLANSFLICLFRVPLLINLCRAGHSSATEAPPTQSHSVSCNCSRRIVAMCLSRLLQSWVPNHLRARWLPRWLNGQESTCNADMGSIPGQGRSSWGDGNPLQYSCLGNPMDRGNLRTTVHGVAESDCD